MKNTYIYQGKTITEKEALELLGSCGILIKAPVNTVKFFVYVFDEEKRFIKKSICNLEPNEDGSISYKYKVEFDKDDVRTYTKRVKQSNLSNPTNIKPNRFSGAKRIEYVTYTEEPDIPYMGGTHLESHYHGCDDYVEGRVIGEKFWARDKYSSHLAFYYLANGVKGPRYEFYSLEPLDEKCFEQWQSDQNWFKIKKFDELYGK